MKNGKGDVLATATLAAGSGARYVCTLTLSFQITEAEDLYVVMVSQCGDMSYWSIHLKTD